MDPELKEIMIKSIETPTFLQRIKQNIQIARLSQLEIDKMKKTIITEVKPIYAKHWLERNNVNIIDKLTVELFDERINTLHKKDIFKP